MTQRNWSWEAKQLLPHLAGMLGSGVTVQAGGGSMVAHALNSTTWHTGTLNESQAPWAVNYTTYDAHVANVNAHHNKQHVLATHLALGGDHTISGATVGHVLRASAPDAAAFAQLQHNDLGGVTANQHHNQLHDVTDAAHHSISGSNLDVVSNVSGAVGLRAGSSDVSAGGSAYLYANAGAIGLRKITSTDTLDLDSATDRVRLLANNRIGTDNYASQVTGWAIDYLGGADFRYVYTDELHAKAFIADLEQALAGGQIISKSVAVLAVDFTAPAAGGTATLRVKDLPSAPNMAVFQSGDIVRLRQFSRAGGGLSITDCWGVVTAYADQTDGTQTWTFTRSAAPNAGAMSAGAVVNADAIVLDYGTTGNGIYEVNAIDGVYALNSPYAQTVTWTGHPATGQVVRTRMGNMRGIFAIANEYGLYAGSGVTDADTFIRLSSYTNRLNNLPMEWWTSGSKIVEINSTVGLSIQTSTAYSDIRSVTWLSGATAIASLGAFSYPGIGAGKGRQMTLGIYNSTATDLTVLNLAANNTLAAMPEISIFARQYAGTGSEHGVGLAIGAAAWSGYDISLWGSTRVHGFLYTEYTATLADVVIADGGLVGAPSFGFADSTSGLYRPAANQIGVTISGTQRLNVLSTGIAVTGAMAATGAVSGTTGTFSGAVSGTTGTFSGALSTTTTVSAAGAITSQNATELVGMSATYPYLGFAIRASATGGWARGFYFEDSDGTRTSGLGAYAANGVMETVWIGLLSDYIMHCTIATKAVQFYGSVATTSAFNSGTSYQRNGVAGTIYVPVAVTNLTDTAAAVWSGAARAVGTYTFDVNSAANGSVPAGVKAVAVMGTFQWAAANNNTYATIQYPAGNYEIVARSMVNNIACDVTGIVQVNTSGQFTVTILNAATTATLLRIVGYYI